MTFTLFNSPGYVTFYGDEITVDDDRIDFYHSSRKASICAIKPLQWQLLVTVLTGLYDPLKRVSTCRINFDEERWMTFIKDRNSDEIVVGVNGAGHYVSLRLDKKETADLSEACRLHCAFTTKQGE